ncbi:hypothetical protein M514_06800 [Trichuris suis]|uniref:ADP-ribosylation factor family protein n=1 Tax=Trichuris suis TaxID=68888 RepID=A0A085NB51_9BILA|nr:hypothetical protein M514_06800 [Trichuris suis]
MGLLTILKKLKEKEKEMRILVIGLDNAGKTTILKRLMGEDVSITTPTFGFNIKTLSYRGYKLNIWDVGGQLMLRSYWRNYFEETDGVLWVVDSTDVERFGDCRKELHSLLTEERLISSTLAILANKQDLDNAVSVQLIHDALQLDQIKGHHWRCFPCSGLTGDNLVEGIDWAEVLLTESIGFDTKKNGPQSCPDWPYPVVKEWMDRWNNSKGNEDVLLFRLALCNDTVVGRKYSVSTKEDLCETFSSFRKMEESRSYAASALKEPQQRTDDDNPRTHEKPEDQQKHQWCRPALKGVPGSRTTAATREQQFAM